MALLNSLKKYIQFTVVVIVFFVLVVVRQMLGDNNQPQLGPIAQLGTPAPSPANSLDIIPPANIRRGEDDDFNPSVRHQATAPSTLAPTKAAAFPIPVSSPSAAPRVLGTYKDGTYTGPVTDAYYGSVQIQVTVSGGKIAAINFLQYPNDNRTSQYVNSQAMPMLQAQALQSQSAQVDGVSGASATSGAFQQSLAVVLQQARV